MTTGKQEEASPSHYLEKYKAYDLENSFKRVYSPLAPKSSSAKQIQQHGGRYRKKILNEKENQYH